MFLTQWADVESFVDWPEGEDFPIYRGEVVQLFKKGTQWEKGKKCKWSKFDKEPYLRSLYPEPSWWGEHPGERKVVTGAFYSGKTIPKKVDFKWVKFANANFKVRVLVQMIYIYYYRGGVNSI